MPESWTTAVSKAVSQRLRHLDVGDKYMAIYSQGRAAILNLVLSTNSGRRPHNHMDVEDVLYIATMPGKQRFILHCRKGERIPTFISAAQGHTVAVDNEAVHTRMDATTLPKVLVHGTYYRHLGSIMGANGGLQPGGKRKDKRDVHVTTRHISDPKNVSGVREDVEVEIHLNPDAVGAALKSRQNKAYLTKQETVLLKKTVPVDQFLRVIGRGTGAILWTWSQGLTPDVKCRYCSRHWPKGMGICAGHNCLRAINATGLASLK